MFEGKNLVGVPRKNFFIYYIFIFILPSCLMISVECIRTDINKFFSFMKFFSKLKVKRKNIILIIFASLCYIQSYHIYNQPHN